MRPIERIDVILDKMDFDYLESYLESKCPGATSVIDAEIKDRVEEIRELWKENSDQRLFQLLINYGYIFEEADLWNKEESTWLIEQELAEPREVVFWGQNYDENGKLLPNTIYKPIKELTDGHLKGIVKYFGRMGVRKDKVLELIEKEIELRRDLKLKYLLQS